MKARLTPAAGILLLLALVPLPATAGEGPLDDALNLLGLTTNDLGVDTRADWLGWVDPETVPYASPHLKGMLRDPLRAAQLGGNALTVACGGSRIRSDRERIRTLLTVLALQPRQSGFRGFAARPSPAPTVTTVLHRLSSANGDSRRHTGARPFGLGPDERALPPSLRPPVARLLSAAMRAADTVNASWVGVDRPMLVEAVTTDGVARLLAGGSVWWPALARAAREGDPVARDHALLDLAQAVATELPELRRAAGRDIPENLAWEVDTPLGRVMVAGRGGDRHRCDGDCLLVIDLGGDDLWEGTAGGAVAPHTPVAVAIDVAGRDRYDQAGAPAAQGAGLGGVGVLVDVAGDDRYTAVTRAQGAALLGGGLLWDLDGNDTYLAEGTAQGAAVFGTGVVLDETGRDTYHVDGEGQGFGGPDGGGVLADLSGDDRYTAQRTPTGGRADYHSDGEVAANNAQGAGVGRRGDLSDGHAWAGGIGLLVDASGSDRYRAGNFAQGSGYWLGIGMLLDGEGDDLYEAVYFSHGSASHFGVGLLLDGAGDDVHWLDGEAGAASGYAWDGAVGILIDAAGSDLYRLDGAGLGCAERRSCGLLLELAGCDSYRLGPHARGLGAVDNDPRSSSVGWPLRSGRQSAVFLDLGGEDTYQRLPRAAPAANDTMWLWPASGDGWSGANLGGGIDLELGVHGIDGLARLLRPARTAPRN